MSRLVAVETHSAVYARMDNRPGMLEKAGRALGARHLNIDAISLETSGSNGFVRILTNKPKDMLDALRSAGIECYESQVVLTSVPNRAGELGRAAADLAAAGINIESIVTTTDGRLAFRTSDNERAAQILKKL